MKQALSMTCREGKTTWQDLDLDDIDLRLKWSGLFHRRKRTPGFFMMRLKVPACSPYSSFSTPFCIRLLNSEVFLLFLCCL